MPYMSMLAHQPVEEHEENDNRYAYDDEASRIKYAEEVQEVTCTLRCFPEFACAVDCHGHIVASNPMFDRMIIEEFQEGSTSFFDFLAPRHRANVERNLLACSTTASPRWVSVNHRGSGKSSEWHAKLLEGALDNRFFVVCGRYLMWHEFGKHLEVLVSPVITSWTIVSQRAYAAMDTRINRPSDPMSDIAPIRSQSIFSFRADLSRIVPTSISIAMDITEDHIGLDGLETSVKRHNMQKHLRKVKVEYHERMASCPAEAKDLNQSLEHTNSFVKAAAEEIRTPLNIVMSGLSVLATEQSNDAEYQQTIADMQQACESAVEVLGDFITYKTLESHLCKLDQNVENLAEILETCLQPFSVEAEHRKVVFRFANALISDCFSIINTETQLMHLAVIDQGTGISSQNQTMLVVPNIVQCDADKLQGGGHSGIGLWVSKKLIDTHGGVLSAGVGDGLLMKGLNVLLVDDSQPIRKLTGQLLRKIGADVAEAKDGTDCIAAVTLAMDENRCFDIVLLVTHMTRLHDPELMSELHRLGYKGKVV